MSDIFGSEAAAAEKPADDPWAATGIKWTPAKAPAKAPAPAAAAPASGDGWDKAGVKWTPASPETGSLGFWGTAGDIAKSGGSGVVKGVEDVPGALGGLTRFIGQKLEDWDMKPDWLITPQDKDRYYAAHPDEQRPMELEDVPAWMESKLGGAGSYKPQSKLGEYAKTVGEFVPMTLATEGLGGALAAGGIRGAAAAAAPGALVRGALVPGVASEAAGQYTKDTPLEPWARAAAGIAGGVGASALTQGASKELVEQAARAGTTLPKGAAGGPVAEVLANAPIIRGPVRAAARQSMGEASEGLEANIAKQMPGVQAADRELAAGDLTRSAMKGWRQGEGRIEAQDAYAPMRAAMVNPSDVRLTNAEQMATTINAERTQAGLAPSPAAQQITDAIQRAPTMEYDGIRRLRSVVGDKIDDINSPSFDRGEWSRMKDALSADMEASAHQAGGQTAVDAMKAGDEKFKSIAGRRAAIGDILGAGYNAPAEKIVDAVLQKAGTGSGADIAALRQAHSTVGGQDWEIIAGGIANRLAMGPNGKADVQTFLKNYNALSENGRTLIFGQPGSGFRQILDSYQPTVEALQKVLPKGEGQHLFGPVFGAEQAAQFLKDPGTWLSTAGGLTTAGPAAAAAGGAGLGVGWLLSRPATASAYAKGLAAQRAQLASRASRIATPVMEATQDPKQFPPRWGQ